MVLLISPHVQRTIRQSNAFHLQPTLSTPTGPFTDQITRPNMPGRLQDKIAIVTGGGFGFGEGIVVKFIAEGAKVVVVDMNQANGERVAAAQPKGSAIFIQADVSSEADWRKIRDGALAQFGRVDIVVNNAGIVYTAVVCRHGKERSFGANSTITVLFRTPREGLRPSHAGEYEEHLFQRASYGACPAATREPWQFRHCMQYQFAASSSKPGLVCCQQRRCECGMCHSHCAADMA